VNLPRRTKKGWLRRKTVVHIETGGCKSAKEASRGGGGRAKTKRINMME
jgi:hypothetical protein